MSESERAARLDAVDEARASVALEGFALSPEVEATSQRYVDGELTGDEHLAAIRGPCRKAVERPVPTAEQEGALAFARIVELQRDPVRGSFDAAHLREVHRRIFQDLPAHTPGQYRPPSEGYAKARALASGHRYYVHYPGEGHAEGVSQVLATFGGAAALRGLGADDFAAKMATLYADLDHLHPFTEGNSRTLRTFTRQLATEAGYDLRWSRTNGTPANRDRLYIARDLAVTRRAFPGLDGARAMSTPDRAEYEAYMLVLQPFTDAPSLVDIVKAATFQVRDLDAATA